MFSTIKPCTYAKLNCLKLFVYFIRIDLALDNLPCLLRRKTQTDKKFIGYYFYLSVYLSIYLLVYVWVFTYMSTCLWMCLYMYMCACVCLCWCFIVWMCEWVCVFRCGRALACVCVCVWRQISFVLWGRSFSKFSRRPCLILIYSSIRNSIPKLEHQSTRNLRHYSKVHIINTI